MEPKTAVGDRLEALGENLLSGELGWALIGLAVVLLVIAIGSRRRRSVRADRGGVAVGGDNPGIIVTGKVKGNIQQHQPVTGSTRATSPTPPVWERVITIAAALSAIIGTLITAWDKLG